MTLHPKRTSESELLAELKLTGAIIKGRSMHCLYPENHKNGDRNPSASYFCGKDGVWRWHCQVCGKGGDVFDVMSLRMGRPLPDILKENTQDTPNSKNTNSKVASSEKMVFSDLPAVYAHLENKYGGKLEALHTYPDNFFTVRWRVSPDKKEMRPLLKQGAQYVMMFPEGKRPLYRRDAMSIVKRGIIVEGEGKVDLLVSLGFPATTSAGGYAQAAYTDWQVLTGGDWIIWPDADVPGKQYAENSRKILEGLGCRVKIVDPSKLDLQEGEDVVDYVQQLRNAGFDENAIKQNLIEVFRSKTLSVGPAAELDSYYAAIIEGTFKNIKTGFSTLDSIIQIMPESMNVVCGSPGASKSLLMLQLMAYWIGEDIRAACFMLERSRSFHLARVLAQLAGISQLTRLDWVQNNPEVVQEAMSKHREMIDRIGRSLWTASGKAVAQADILEWARQRAESGHKVLIVDPATLAERRDEPYRADEVFVQGLKGIAEKFKCSIIIVLHPQKGMVITPDLSTVAGGAVYGRAADNVLWLDHHREPQKSNIAIANGFSATEEIEHNRTIIILKSRDGSGTFAKIAYELSCENLMLSEMGLILRKKKN